MEYASRDFPPNSTVYSSYRKWQKRGVWQQLNHTLRDQLGKKIGRATQPSGMAADSQSVKTTQKRRMCTALMALN
jgi:putative transposase